MPPSQNPSPQEPIPEPKQPSGAYDFIFEPPSNKKSGSGSSLFIDKKFLIAGASLLVLLIMGILLAVMSGGPSPTSVQLTTVAARQQELIRVSDIALKTSKSPATLATATTLKASLTSEQKQVLGLISDSGTKLEKGQLSIKQSKKTDETLNSAAQSNAFDSAYNDYLKNNLKAYQTELKELYALGGVKTKAVATSAYDSTELIVKSI